MRTISKEFLFLISAVLLNVSESADLVLQIPGLENHIEDGSYRLDFR